MKTGNKMIEDEKVELLMNAFLNVYKATAKEESEFQIHIRIIQDMEEMCDDMDCMYLQKLGDIELPKDENEALLIKARIFNKITGSECEFETLPVDIQEMIYEIVIDMDNRSFSPEGIEESDDMLKRIYQAIEEDQNSSFSLIA